MSQRIDLPARRLARNEWLLDVVRKSRVDVVGSAGSAREARRAIAEQYGGVLEAQELDVMRLLVSELVTNAVVHGGANETHHVIVHFAVAPHRVRLEVCDDGPGLDPESQPRRSTRGGNGFVILDALASRWGVSTDDGTCVWSELDRPA